MAKDMAITNSVRERVVALYEDRIDRAKIAMIVNMPVDQVKKILRHYHATKPLSQDPDIPRLRKPRSAVPDYSGENFKGREYIDNTMPSRLANVPMGSSLGGGMVRV